MSTKPEHRALYAGSYQRRARTLCRTATLNPDTRCQAPGCNRTLAEHPHSKTGTPPKWSAGHAWPNDPTAPLQPEVLGCNIAEGNDRRHGNTHSETW